jgi:uncharacterized protein DUF5670
MRGYKGVAERRCPDHSRPEAAAQRRPPMLWTIIVILLVLWLLGMGTAYTLGGLIHILLVIAVIVIVIRLIQGRRPVP